MKGETTNPQGSMDGPYMDRPAREKGTEQKRPAERIRIKAIIIYGRN